jgi:hypothetical protein
LETLRQRVFQRDEPAHGVTEENQGPPRCTSGTQALFDLVEIEAPAGNVTSTTGRCPEPEQVEASDLEASLGKQRSGSGIPA